MALNMDFVRQYAADVQERKLNSPNRDIRQYGMRQGQNRGRMAPPWPNSGDIAMKVWKHFKVPSIGFAFCYENTFPGRGIQCPICVAIAKIKAAGIECWRQSAVCQPRTNWIDRFPLDQFGNVLPLAQHPGPCLIDLNLKVYDSFMTMAASTMCDLTSMDMGYDVVIEYDSNAKKNKFANYFVVPGPPSPLCPDPEIAKRWISQLYDMQSIMRLPNWSNPDGQSKWKELCEGASALERSYFQPQASAPGFGQPGFPPQQQPQGTPAPVFTQPSALPGPGYAPVPQPAMHYGHVPQSPAPQPPGYVPAPQPPAPQMANPSMMGSPGAVPFTPQPAPQAPQPASPVPQTYTPPANPPLPPPPPGFQTSSSAPPWESPSHPPAPQNVIQMPSNQPPAPQAPQSPPQPAPAPAPVPQPTLTNTSSDSLPPCFGHSRKDKSVSHPNVDGTPVTGGWSPLFEEVLYRCRTCAHELQCKSTVLSKFAADYEGLPV